MLSLVRLRTLQEVAHHGGLSAAARSLHFTPSAVSQQISALEDELGTPVLEKAGRTVRLTEAGRVLLEHAEGLLAAEAAARAAVERTRQAAEVRLTIGVFASVASGLVPTLFEELDRSAPHIRISTREVDPEDAVVQLKHGRLDASFILDYPEAPETWSTGLSFADVGTDRLAVALPAAGDLRDDFVTGTGMGLSSVGLAELADRDWILASESTYYGRAVRAACARAGFTPRVVHEVEEQATALALVDAGLGVTLVSDLGRGLLPEGVQVAELVETISRRVMLASLEASSARPAVAALVAAATRATAVVAEHDDDY
ncbi:LysR family transcriptional regulator [Nocardioides bruguierae]|uniref:LysR family transcriptional regulator n=1 Tax=Nocardioides bruguierae TaxID=2945102 RepID=UPI002021E0F7|nr:LysR family transcriptional regulator [Nocardioides bruguierae]MCL8025353.1 LysR family transcriptional regulator [Nocardioides bruguierae]